MPDRRPGTRDGALTRGRAAAGGRAIGNPGEAAISATITEPPAPEEIGELAGVARYLELRADLAGDLDPAALRERFEGRLVYSLRSAENGGEADESPSLRRRRLLAAADRFDVVDLEHGRDTDAELLDRIPPQRRRISWHGPAAGLDELRERFERMAEVPARLYLIAPKAGTVADGLAPLRLLAELRRTDVAAFATGPAGTWSRLLAPRLGARVIYGRLREAEHPGPVSVRRLVSDFGLPMMGRLRDLYGMVGGAVEHSLAPRIYNKGFRALGLPALCLPFSVDDFGLFWNELVGRGLPGLGIAPRGLTVVTPHKEAALVAATILTPGARVAGAANSLVRAGGAWQGATTTRVAGPLRAAGFDPFGRRAAIVGCGGAGRSIAAELRGCGADVTLVNRGEPRGAYASEHLGLPLLPLSRFSPGEYDLIVHATTLVDESPFDPAAVAPSATVVDLGYRAGATTALVAALRSRGVAVLSGRRILAAETGGQFELMTGQPMPPDAVGIASGQA